jgi:trehalose 6-phosphate synthase/phosphatase
MTSDACLKYQHVFEYFTERTPRSHFELRQTSLVWNYKYTGTRKYIRPYFRLLQLVLFLLVKVTAIILILLFHSLINLCINATLDIEFGRLQARDMLQHLWTGPISNASVDVVRGGRCVEVRAVGVTKVYALCLAGSL